MSVLYKGWGTILIFAFPFLFGMVIWLAGPEMEDNMSFGIALLLSTIPLWFSGRKLNAKKEIHINHETGEKVEKSPHTCFFIPIEYYALLSFVAGLYLVLL